ncbi:MAG: hypothetical protein J3R72DRAFT_403207, partial [Linnemannia gamsii]
LHCSLFSLFLFLFHSFLHSSFLSSSLSFISIPLTFPIINNIFPLGSAVCSIFYFRLGWLHIDIISVENNPQLIRVRFR